MSAALAFLAGLTGGACIGYALRARWDRDERARMARRTPGDRERDEMQARDSLGRC